ncbi:hypothetical protein MN0502_13210 [Arthrobacter sp. MN05-02]|nr:hypothetical protein MN0502_13210 [Arthrobacter sp. MN05-02]
MSRRRSSTNVPELLTARIPADRGTKLLTWLADVTVNQPNGARPAHLDPREKLPELPGSSALPDTSTTSADATSSGVAGAAGGSGVVGSRRRLLELGPEGFARALREQTAVAVTDTTFRDAHQSLLATRVRTRDLVAAGASVSALTPELLSVEAWGGATYDVTLRFLGEDPWERLDALRRQIPDICLQMLLRGRNTVGYTPYPEAVTTAFVTEAAASGHRHLPDLRRPERRVPDGTGDPRGPGHRHRCRRSRPLLHGGHARSGRDPLHPGLLPRPRPAHRGRGRAHPGHQGHGRAPAPAAAAQLVAALRERFDLPVHLHTHDTAGGQLATLLAAVDAGVDAVDVASAPLAGTTSQPSASALVAALAHTPRDTGLDLDAVCALEPYWEAVRRIYAPFESGLPGPTGRVYRHEIPGGQLSNLKQQAIALGLGERFEAIEDMYTAADRILGRLVKVTPSSKVVGDLALALVGSDADPAAFEQDPQDYDIPDSVIGFLNGDLGNPPGGWPEPFRTKALTGRELKPRDAHITADDETRLKGSSTERRQALNRLLFAGPTKDFQTTRDTYGDVSVLGTADYLYGLQPGTEHVIELDRGGSGSSRPSKPCPTPTKKACAPSCAPSTVRCAP